MKKIISLCLVAMLTILSVNFSESKIDAADLPETNYTINANQKFVKDHKNDVASDILKIIAPSEGIMTITFTGAIEDLDNKKVASAYLVDSKKVNYIYSDFDKKSTYSIPVKKGEVFYLKVLCTGTQYSVTYNVKKVKTFSKATSRKKAPTLKKNKNAAGIIFSSDKVKNAKWYKIKIKKKTKINVTLKFKGIGYDYDMYLYNQKGKKVSWSVDSTNKKKAKLKKGTYYIKVGKTPSEEGDTVAGTYTLKWK